jgi:hypothetical protein
MPPKKSSALRAALQPLDINQETLCEARSQKRKATSPTPQDEELDQEIRDLEAIHQQVQRKKEKMLRLADLQKKIEEAAEEMHHLTQDDQDRRPQHRELRQDNFCSDDEWYDNFHHGNFAFDDASPLSAELQATPWPPSYKPPQLPMYDGHSDPKQFLMSYEATISSYGGQHCSHGEILRHGSQKCCTNLVLFSSARNNYIMAEAEGYADHQFPRISDEASHGSGFVLVHARQRGIPSSVCLKVLASESTRAHSAQ